MRNGEVFRRVKEERNKLHKMKTKEGQLVWCGLCRNCVLKHVIEGKVQGRIEVTGRRGRRRKQLLDDLKGKNREFCKSNEETLGLTLWRCRFGRGYGFVTGRRGRRRKQLLDDLKEKIENFVNRTRKR